VILGVTGGSGSGKSMLTAAVRDRLGREECAVLGQDSYYRDLSHLSPAARADTNFDAPAAVELTLLGDHLRALASGRPVRPPVYDMTNHTRRGEGAPVGPAERVIVEGLLLTAEPAVAKAIDVLVFVDLEDAARLARRIARDVSERGRTEAEVRRRWRAHALPMHRAWVAPARDRADLVVWGDAPVLESVERIMTLLA